MAELVVAERGQKRRATREACELDGGNRPASGRGLPSVGHVEDLAGGREPRQPQELGPLDMTDHCQMQRTESITEGVAAGRHVRAWRPSYVGPPPQGGPSAGPPRRVHIRGTMARWTACASSSSGRRSPSRSWRSWSSFGAPRTTNVEGTVVGFVPYDFRPPTIERARSRWWNPDEPRLFVPQVFGVGWTINLARLVGLVSGLGGAGAAAA